MGRDVRDMRRWAGSKVAGCMGWVAVAHAHVGHALRADAGTPAAEERGMYTRQADLKHMWVHPCPPCCWHVVCWPWLTG
jgi:hypothetical protein